MPYSYFTILPFYHYQIRQVSVLGQLFMMQFGKASYSAHQSVHTYILILIYDAKPPTIVPKWGYLFLSES